MKTLRKNQMEVWKSIKNYDGYYEISDYGNVKSLKRDIERSDGTLYRVKKDIILRPAILYGYPKVRLNMKNKGKMYFIHCLVANAFIINKPKSCKYEVMHLDGNKLNNHISNLRFGSHRCNEAFKEEHGTLIKGESHFNSKLTESDVKKIRRLRSKGSTIIELGKLFGVWNTTISAIITGKTWSWLQSKRRKR